MIFAFALVIIMTSMTYFSLVTSNNNTEQYKTIANNLAATTASVVDPTEFNTLKEEVDVIYQASPSKPTSEDLDEGRVSEENMEAYISQYEAIQSEPVFLKVRDFLRKIESANNVYADCLYLIYLDKPNQHFIYVVDSAPEDDACPPGWIDPLYDFNSKVLDDPTIGFPAYITKTPQYGWLVTSGSPVYDSSNKVIGYACCDISMDLVRKTQADSIMTLFMYLMISLVIVSTVGAITIHFVFMRPVQNIAKVANSYDPNNIDATHEVFKDLAVKTNDELTDLAESLKKIESDVKHHIEEITIKNKELAVSQNKTKRMKELANSDGLTGVRNKVAWNSDVARQNKHIKQHKDSDFAIVMVDLNYLKETNDKYGHDTGDICLKRLAKLICNVYAHSPVYRIGGDEFAVILKGEDYADRVHLEDSFKTKIAANLADKTIIEKHKISAAIGTASYDKEKDRRVEDVFKRADKLMYACKKEMKSRK